MQSKRTFVLFEQNHRTYNFRKETHLSSNIWTKKAADILKNLNFYKTSVLCMRELLTDNPDGEIMDKLRQTERLVSCVELAMKMLTDEDRYFLEKMFISAGECPVDDICAECMMEKSNVYRLRKRALDKFTMAMYGRL